MDVMKGHQCTSSPAIPLWPKSSRRRLLAGSSRELPAGDWSGVGS
jgi:hypothetical protein